MMFEGTPIVQSRWILSRIYYTTVTTLEKSLEPPIGREFAKSATQCGRSSPAKADLPLY
jgi:hypothetical protein